MGLSFDDLKKASTLKTVDVDVPEFGGAIKLRQLDGKSGLCVATKAPQGDDKTGEAMSGFYVELIAQSVVDDAGALMLNSKEGRELIGGWPFNVLSSIGSAAAELNGMIVKKSD